MFVNQDVRYTPLFAWLAKALDEDVIGRLLDTYFFPATGRGQTTFLRALANTERLRPKDTQALLEPLGDDVWEDHHIDLALSIVARGERTECRAIRKIVEAEIRSGRVSRAAVDRRALHLIATDPPEHREPLLTLMGAWREWAPVTASTAPVSNHPTGVPDAPARAAASAPAPHPSRAPR
jgi:hypothetical protein